MLKFHSFNFETIILNLEKVFSNLEPEGQGRGIIIGVTRLLLQGPFYTIEMQFYILFCTRLYYVVTELLNVLGNLRLAVKLPEGEDVDEWIAVNTVDFFNQINMLYGTITEFCTEDGCPIMSAGPKYEYHWADGQTVKKPIKCSAPKYIDYLMTWVQDQLDDEALFPSKIGVKFPPNFQVIVKTILKRLFRVYAHIYHQHFK